MVTSIVLIALIGILQFNSAISAAINYEPIKITVNENFNAQPGQISPELQEPGVLHQGANFYFKPQLNLPPSYIPSHIEALISLMQQHHHSCSKDTSKVVVAKDKLIEILKPFMNPLLDISKETLSEIVHEKENNLEIVKPIIISEEPKPVTPELLVIPQAPVLPSSTFNGSILSVVEEEAKKEESIFVEEPTGIFPIIPDIAERPIEEPIINYVEPKSAIQELVAIPEAPVLPSLSLHEISPIIEEEGKKEESIIFKETTGVFPTIPEIAVRPIEEPIINYVEPKAITSELIDIPEAPVLPSLSLHEMYPIIEEGKKEESIIFKETTGVFPTIPEIAVRPIEEPIINYIEPKPITSELIDIPEAPVLPSLSLHEMSPIIEEEGKKEESIIFKETTGVFPTIPEIAVRPIEEPIINYVEPKPITSELIDIPEAPVLPSLSLHEMSPFFEEEGKKEESIIFKETTGVFPTIPEIAVRPIEEPIINYVEPKPITSELIDIPEAPVLPSLSLHEMYPIIEEGKKEESIIFKETTGVFPTIPEIAVRPIEEPIINYVEPKAITSELIDIPEAPVLPSLSLHEMYPIIEEGKKEESIIFKETTGVFPTIPEIAVRPIEEPIINYVEPKPITSELIDIPEAPVLPSLSLHEMSPFFEEEGKKEESIIFKETTGVFPTIPEIAVRPIEEPIINYVEPKPITSELIDIPEAPVLPSLSLHEMYPIIEEGKKEESIILKETTGVFPTIPEIAVRPIEEPIINYIEPKPITSELIDIPEAPVLPSLSLHEMHPIFEEGKKEESIIFKETTSVFPTIPEIAVRPIEEPIINYAEPKPITSELIDIPEAPVLPSLSLHHISSIIEEEGKKEESIIFKENTGVFPTIPEIAVRPITESIINNVESKPIHAEFVFIPEAPVLPPLSVNDNHVVEEEVKMEEPIIVDVEAKPITSKLVDIPEAPALPPLPYNGFYPVVEEVKIEESIKVEECTGSIPEISARPFPEPLVVSETAESFALENNIFPVATEEVKIEIPILLEESIEVFPPIAEFSSGPTLEESSPEMTDSYVLEAVSEPNPESVVTVNETLPPTIIPKPSNHLGVFSYVPFVYHLCNRASKTKNLMIPKPASLERFLLKKHAFRLPVTPFPKLDLNAIKSSIWGNKKQFLYPTSYAHDVVEKRIAPNMAFKKQNAPKRVKIYIRSNVPKGTSYL